MSLLLLPSIQKEVKIFKIRALKGYYILSKKDSLSVKSWFDGSFQEKYTNYLNDHVGFRPPLVKIHNQIKYSLYDEVGAAGVVVGKNNYLYEQNYIDAYFGKDFLGEDSIQSIVNSLTFIRDTLKSKGTEMLVCLAAGKGSFYPEYFPNEYENNKRGKTNMEIFSSELTKKDIPLINFNSWFCSIKDTSKYPLYPQYGIHWSEYGMTIVADSLIRFTEKLLQVDMPNYVITDVELSKKPLKTDYDVGESLNLLFKMPTFPMAYPKTYWESDSTFQRVKAIVISDSFFWGIYNMGIMSTSFEPGGFWYYFEQAYPNDKKVSELNIKEELESQDIIIFITTEATIARFPFGFIEEVYPKFYSNTN